MKTHMFKGMINDQVSPLTSTLQELVVSMPSLSDRLHDRNAQRHARHGIVRRLLILRVNIKHILSLTDRPKEKPLYGDAQNELGMHLNSFYIHLHGLLDNLAWLLAHELNMFGSLSEENHADRRQVGLFRNEFCKALQYQPTKELLARQSEWSSLTKKLRDPIAHRVPLYAIPCILTHAQSEKFNQLNEQEMQALVCGDFARSEAIHKELFSIGEYHPVFCQEENGQPVMCSIREQVEYDSKRLIEILWHFIEDEKTTQLSPAGCAETSAPEE